MDMQTAISPSSAAKSGVIPGSDFLVISAWDRAAKSSGTYFAVHQDELQREGNRIKYVGPEIQGCTSHDPPLQKNEFIHDIVGQFDTLDKAHMKTIQMNMDYFTERRGGYGMSEDFHEIADDVHIRGVDNFLQLRDSAELIAVYQFQRDEETFRDFIGTSSWLDVWDTQPMLDLRQAVAEPAKAGTAIGRVFASQDMPLSNETIERLNGLSGDHLISPKAMGYFLYDGHHVDHTGQMDITRGEYQPLNSYITRLENVQKQTHAITKGRDLDECRVIINSIDHPNNHSINQPQPSPLKNFLTRAFKEFVNGGRAEGSLAPDFNRTYKHKAGHPAERAARKAAEQVSKQVSGQMQNVQPPENYFERARPNAILLTDCLNTAIEQGNGREIHNIGVTCGVVMPMETAERFENLAASHLLKAPALADIFAKGGDEQEKALRLCLMLLEQIQHKMQQELTNDPAYQHGALQKLGSAQLNLSPAEIKQVKTLVSEGRLLPSDINHVAASKSAKTEAEFKNIVGKALGIRENQMDRGFGRSL